MTEQFKAQLEKLTNQIAEAGEFASSNTPLMLIDAMNTEGRHHSPIAKILMMANCNYLRSFIENEWDTPQDMADRLERIDAKQNQFIVAQNELARLMQ